MRLFLVDDVFVPALGAWGFRQMPHKTAVQGIQLAFDEGKLVNMVARYSSRLTKITGRKIVDADVGRALSAKLDMQTVPGEMVLMYHEVSPSDNGDLYGHVWLSAVRLDVTSVEGLGNLMARALPEDMELLEFAACVTASAEHDLLAKREAEVSDES